MKRFDIYGKKWFDKVNGNTYHVAYLMDNETGKTYQSEFTYGYDRQYELTAYNLAIQKGLIDERELAFSDFIRTVVNSSKADYYLKRELSTGGPYIGKRQKI